MVRPYISKETVIRASICPEERLVVTLQHTSSQKMYVIMHKIVNKKKIIKFNFRQII